MEIEHNVAGHSGNVLTTSPPSALRSAREAISAFRVAGRRPRPQHDEFFDEGELEYRLAWQQLNQSTVYIPAVLPLHDHHDANDTEPVAPWRASNPIVCRQAPCHGQLSFSSASAYEQHYDTNHRHLCYSCGKPMPGERWLELHIHEMHDILVQIRRERGERTYQCFVRGCQQAFKSTHGRRLHLIDLHKYPRSFNFDIVQEGVLPYEKRLRKMGLKNAHKAFTAMRRASVTSDSSMDEVESTSPVSSRESTPTPFISSSGGNSNNTQSAEAFRRSSGSREENYPDNNNIATSGSFVSHDMEMEVDQLQASFSNLKIPRTTTKAHRAPIDQPKLRPGFYRGPPIRTHQHQTSHAVAHVESSSALPSPWSAAVEAPPAISRTNTWMIPRQVKKTATAPSKTPLHPPVMRDIEME